jgi:hypothetical protein
MCFGNGPIKVEMGHFWTGNLYSCELPDSQTISRPFAFQICVLELQDPESVFKPREGGYQYFWLPGVKLELFKLWESHDEVGK